MSSRKRSYSSPGSFALFAYCHWPRKSDTSASVAAYPGIDALKGRADALYACADALVSANAARIDTLALTARLPTMFYAREYIQDGGFMSYGPNVPELFRRSAEFVDKILRGAKPADIPVEQPTTLELVINVRTAKALGLHYPPRCSPPQIR